MLSSAGKQFTVNGGSSVSQLLHEAGEKILSAIEVPGNYTMLGGEIGKGKNFLYQISQDGKILDMLAQKITSISKEAEQILFDILV